MSDSIIKVEGLSKKFCRSIRRSMFYGTIDVVRNMIGIPYKTDNLRPGEFWALEDINFELKEGETLGIIGANGSGKSTLLRLLTGIFPPDKGRITVKGKIGALIAVGAGFHPHMSGRENVYLNGTLLGMKRKEIDEKFDSIIEFAEIEDFLDAPVSTYSSGMRVRLGFAVAIHAIPEILLVDEVLSVGDLSFRNKCLRYMSNIKSQSKALIFISHNLEQVRNLCSRLIVMSRGKIVFNGDTNEGIIRYQEISRKDRKLSISSGSNSNILGSIADDKVRFIEAGIMNESGKKVDNINTDEAFSHYIDIEVLEDMDELIFSSGVFDENNNQVIWVISNDNKEFSCKKIKKGRFRVRIDYLNHHLMPGVYTLSHGIRNPITYETFHKVTNVLSFVVNSSTLLERAAINTNYKWNIEQH